MDGWNKIVEQNGIDAKMSGYPIRMEPICNDLQGNPSLSLKCLIFQEMIKKGIFLSILGTTFISYSHSINDVDKTLMALDQVCQKIISTVKNENYEKYVEGELPKTIWSMKIQPTRV
jgi:hypothetical protein